MTADQTSTAAPAAGRVHVHVADGIGTVTFHHPKGNSLPGDLLRQMASSIRTLGADDAVRVIVLRSEGSGPFCAGASFDELVAISDAESGRAFFSGFALVILAMIRAPKFVLTRVQGKTAGGGVGLVAASDFSFAVDGASAKLSELAVGIGPFVVGPCIERKIGLAGYSAMAVDADWRDAAWCERQGLYSRLCVSTEEMDEALDALARTLSQSNPAAMAQLKRVFWAGTDDWDHLLDERARMSGAMVLSDFTRDAITKFRQRS
ncbi:MAG TPA: enoyl-CoA hydratase/isomerase family protein [Gemmatimonadaceae bacterium]|jgi:methylglutaconyl-CoA hydratase|nr:enoyl-CoA hydratase/isomerase family protein [Gemmatimonadaceae bacterium]